MPRVRQSSLPAIHCLPAVPVSGWAMKLSDMSAEQRGATIRWARERVGIPHKSPARDAAIMLLDLVQACTEVTGSSIDDDWLRDVCHAALYGPMEGGE